MELVCIDFYSPLPGQHGPSLRTVYLICSLVCVIEKCISGENADIVVSNVPKKYAILAGYKTVMNQRSVCTRFIIPCHSGFALVSRDLYIAYKPRIWFITITYKT